MSRVAFVPRDDEPLPRAKPLPRGLLGVRGVDAPTPQAAPDLVYRKGARELFFRSAPLLRPLLNEACSKAAELFGLSARMALAALIDPEDESAAPLLYLVIGTDLPAAEARDVLDRFDDDWWLDNMERGQGKLHVTVEFL